MRILSLLSTEYVYDFLVIPESAEQYYQEIGRAARDGNAANAYMLYTDKNIDVKGDYFIDNSFPSEDLLRDTPVTATGSELPEV